MSPKKQISNVELRGETQTDLAGRLLALDPGQKRVGVAVSDELQITVRPLQALQRSNWKKLLLDVEKILIEFDAKALVIGLPLTLDGNEGASAINARQLARKFELSLDIPIFLQDERLTSHEAEETLRGSGHTTSAIKHLVDSESAAIILRDFIENRTKHFERP